MPLVQTVWPVVVFSGVPGAAQISARELKFVAQFHGAIRRSSSRSGSRRMRHWIASFEPSVSEAMVLRVPIEDNARLAISTGDVMTASYRRPWVPAGPWFVPWRPGVFGSPRPLGPTGGEYGSGFGI